LLVFADRDPMGSARAGRRLAEALPDAELQIADGGHCPWLDNPERIAGWVNRFLERTTSTPQPSMTIEPIRAMRSK
jgi:pimeloyl-ACP methyl ester carboxylesterase